MYVEPPPKFASARSPLQPSLHHLLKSYFKYADGAVAKKILEEAGIYTTVELRKNQFMYKKGDRCALRTLRDTRYDTMFHEQAYRVASRMLEGITMPKTLYKHVTSYYAKDPAKAEKAIALLLDLGVWTVQDWREKKAHMEKARDRWYDPGTEELDILCELLILRETRVVQPIRCGVSPRALLNRGKNLVDWHSLDPALRKVLPSHFADSPAKAKKAGTLLGELDIWTLDRLREAQSLYPSPIRHARDTRYKFGQEEYTILHQLCFLIVPPTDLRLVETKECTPTTAVVNPTKECTPTMAVEKPMKFV
ncbi:hypothetical protein HK104_008554 [Borealophlyctis nickersoniae]|nr:hypothetical protein HK104_008554 [Borealophlyctis nickersoniae]